MPMAAGTRMATVILTTTPTAEMDSLAPAALLQLMWLASPALPVGAFSYSDGLEAAIDAGLVQGEATAAPWLLQQLALSLARSELPLVAAALRAWSTHDAPRIHELNTWALASRETAELRLQAEQMGRSMRDWLRQRAPDDARVATLAGLDPPAWAVSFALAAALADAPERPALLSFGYAWAEGLVQAAVKAIPLGQNAGQRLLRSVVAALPAAVERALTTGDTDRVAFAPMAALLSARHETQYSRLFRS